MTAARCACGQEIRTKRLHAKHAFGGWAERYRDEALTAKTLANDTDARYFAHHAEAHPLPAVVLPATFNDKGRCEVRVACLEEALLTDERFGIRGGLSERERRKLKKAVS